MKFLFSKSKIIAFPCAFLCSFLYATMPKEIEQGVYVGKSFTAAGEPIYFGMERLDENNRNAWKRYVNQAHDMVGPRGIILEMALRLSTKSFCELPHSRLMPLSGFLEEEYSQYLEKFKKSVLVQRDPLTVSLFLRDIGSGCYGYEFFTPTHIVYISKTPITGRFPFPRHMRKKITLKEFNTIYDSIIMTVGCLNHSDISVYENRGIFRNPSSFVDGGYRGLSKMLHGFTAAVAQRFFHIKTHMHVNPLPSMAKILRNAGLSNDETFMRNHQSSENLSEYNTRYSTLEEEMFIDINALAILYLE